MTPWPAWAADHRLFLGGAGASAEVARELGAEYLPGTPVASRGGPRRGTSSLPLTLA